jgi:hypothetical protein
MLTKKTTTLACLALALSGTNALAQKLVPTTGPEVVMEGAPITTHVEAGATRSFSMKGSFAGAKAAQELSQRLMARGRVLRTPIKVNLTASPDNSKLSFVGKEDPSAFVQIDNTTGDISFCRGMKGLEVKGNTPNLPRDGAATSAAIRHLDALGLLPAKREEMMLQHIGGLRMSSRNEQGETADFEKLVTVHFGRVIDGVQVGGPGSKITVHLGADGELVGLQRRWIEVEATSHRTRDFLSRSETLNLATDHLRTEWDRAERVVSTRPDMGLFDDGRGRIEPAFFFKADLTYDEEKHEFARGDFAANYLGVVPALRNSKASFRQQSVAPAAPSTSSATDSVTTEPAGDDEPSRK